MKLRSLCVLWLLTACQEPGKSNQPEDSSPAGDSSSIESSPPPGDSSESLPIDSDSTSPPDSESLSIPVEPDWTVEEMTSTLQGVLDYGLPSPKILRDHYFRLLEEGQDADCPGGTQLDGTNPQGCTSDLGYFYAGVSTWDESYTEVQNYWLLSGDFEIIDAAGNSFESGGHAGHNLQTQYDGFFWWSEVSGYWRLENDPDWLGQGISSLFQTNGTLAGESLKITMNGGLTYRDLPMYFEGIEYQNWDCGMAVNGDLWVRDPSGAWWTISFVYDCDQCAPVTFAGEAMGEACISLDTVTTMLYDDMSVP